MMNDQKLCYWELNENHSFVTSCGAIINEWHRSTIRRLPCPKCQRKIKANYRLPKPPKKDPLASRIDKIMIDAMEKTEDDPA